MRPFTSKYQFRYKALVLGLFIIAILGGFLSFIFLAKTESVSKALLIGYFYALTLVLILIFVHKVVVTKLRIFNTIQQWTLRTFIYMITLSVIYLNGLLFQTVILTPRISFAEILSDKFWSSLVAFLSSPLDLKFSESIFPEEYRGILIPFFAVLILIGMISIIGSYVEMRWQQNKQKQAIDRAELTALKAQIEPHFFFNSLNTIASQIKVNPEQAEQLIIKLSDILRYVFENTSKEIVLIEEEIDFLKKYLELMQARYGQKLLIEWHQQLNSQQIVVPSFLFQPIVENALRHGWRNDGRNLKLVISFKENSHMILFSVRDDGQGIAQNRIKKLPIPGHALANIYERLQLIYKRKDLMQINSTYEQGTMVSLQIPKGVL
jgi:sensor histidine kinase YesM